MSRPSNKMHEELFGLIVRHQDSSATDADRQRLQDLLAADPAAREFYLGQVFLAARLRWALGKASVPAELPAAGSTDQRAQLDGPTDTSDRDLLLPTPVTTVSNVPLAGILNSGLSWLTSSVNSPRMLLMLVCGALAGYFLAVLALIPLARWSREQQLAAQRGTEEVASSARVVSPRREARWSPASPSPPSGALELGRRYELLAGEADLVLPLGTRVVVQGPAVWKIDSNERLALEAGKLAAWVPPAARGFTVVTPSAEVVDLGTEFGVEVDDQGSTDVHVLKGLVQVKQAAGDGGAPAGLANTQKLAAGQAVRVSSDGALTAAIPLQAERFANLRPAAAVPPVGAAAADRVETIWLGNLFDDSRGTSLAAAMKTDTFRASADLGDLGVERVLYGGEPLRRIAPRVMFDLTNLGWLQESFGHIANDAWTDQDNTSADSGPKGGIRTRGIAMGEDEPRMEEGIGMHSSSLVTFDLNAIRAAGGLDAQSLTFICERAGIGDDRFGQPGGSVHMAALLLDSRQVLSALLDGEPAQVHEAQGVWSFDKVSQTVIRPDGHFAEFTLPIRGDARYLTLVVAAAGDGFGFDHAVWSGARLVVSDEPTSQRRENAR